MDASALFNAEWWLSWISVGKLIAALLVAVGVAIEFGGDWIARPYEKIVREAREAEVARLTNETERLKGENLRLQAMFQPRQIVLMDRDGDAKIRAERFAAVERFKGTQVRIEAVPDFEARKLAGAIARALRWKGWDVGFVEIVPPELIREGVTIVTLDERLGKPVPPGQPSQSIEMPPAAKALLELLRLDLEAPYGPVSPFGVTWTATYPPFSRAVLGPSFADALPGWQITVLIGMKPVTTAFIGPAPASAVQQK